MPTLKDIAKHAKVSLCTVSRYLNHDIKIKDETAGRIENAIRELNYIPNVAAKALKYNVTSNIAVILPKINHLYYSEMTSGISEILGAHHYNLFIFEVNNLHMEEDRIISLMRENMVAGIIFIGLSYDFSFKDQLNRLQEWGIPAVYVNRMMEEALCPLVYPDLKKAGQLAADHLAEKGNRHLALVYSKIPESLLSVYRSAFETNGRKETPSIYEFHAGKEDELARRLLKDGVDGIFVLNELNSVCLTKALVRAGVEIPQRISVLSFGNSLMSLTSTPELSGIDLQDRRLGAESALVMINQIKGRPYEPVTVLNPVLIQREST